MTFANGQGTIEGSHTYADNGIYNISIELTDPTGNTAVSTTTATISNVAPALVPAVDQSVDQGAELSLAVASFTDPGFTDAIAGSTESFTATIDWGDGTISTGVISTTPGAVGVLTTGSVAGNHTYSVPGSYTVQVTVADDDGGSSSTSFAVDVADIPASLGPIDSISADEGAEVALQANFTDLPSDGTYSATIDWGDGTTADATIVFADGSGTISASHIYADNGTYGITVELTDPAAVSYTHLTLPTICSV